jgi:tRNA wybutosine-synthesizing protein 1
MVPEKLRKELERQHYKVVGGHSAVKLCHWTRKSLRDGGVCYKEKFYGIKSHGCLQMSPNITCNNNCLYCWRVIDHAKVNLGKEWDEPAGIIDDAIKAQRLLLSGFKGFSGVNLAKWKEAQNPTNAAISLIGEPTLYPKLSGLIEEFHRMGVVTFLVTNGQYPDVLEKLAEPDQLYLSLDAQDKATYIRLDRPSLKGPWDRMLKSLDAMQSMSCRRVVRLTMVKGWNMSGPEEYAKLIEIAQPDFVEVKGYMHVGESQKRLPKEAMPSHEEIKDFAQKVSEELGYPVAGEQKASRVVLLSKKNRQC